MNRINEKVEILNLNLFIFSKRSDPFQFEAEIEAVMFFKKELVILNAKSKCNIYYLNM